MKEIKRSIYLFLLLTILLGLIYPLSMTLISQIIFPEQANGNLIKSDGRIIGSNLIGQNFQSPKYFHGRPSAVDYNASNSSGSNLAPNDKKLTIRVKESLMEFRQENGLNNNETVPADIVLTSGSGLEPYISVESAMLQASRISSSRALDKSVIIKIINDNIEYPLLGGGRMVNVLKLNLALDSI
ncbi:MAG: potassium-transporting ATPase subunit KdpC [Methanobacteriaceae archaeon]|nr:potassium-transporting ATPase subunit KdpC [Methanobacteriaceae archaeon]